MKILFNKRTRKLKTTTAPPDSTKLTASSVLTRAETVAFFAERLIEPREEERAVRNRVGHRIAHAVGKGALQEHSPGHYRCGGLILWAQKQQDWLGKFADLAHVSDPVQLVIADCSASSGIGSVKLLQLPRNLEKCHQEIQRLTAQVSALENELGLKNAEILSLRPDAEQRRTNAANCRLNGAKRPSAAQLTEENRVKRR